MFMWKSLQSKSILAALPRINTAKSAPKATPQPPLQVIKPKPQS
jgi:hypothetical protein